MVNLTPSADVSSYLRDLEKFGIKLGLDNMNLLCEALAHPERTFKSLVIGGTNGKGSVAAMTEAALRADGYHTGRYTSPHLIRLEERISIAGKPITTRDFEWAVETVRHAVNRLRREGRLEVSPTFFEVTTAAAFVAFRQAEVELAVLEVGLGGRFDATNVVHPVGIAITTIALDHEAQLGKSISDIAYEKAGVIKPNTVVVLGQTVPEIHDLIAATCREQGARFIDSQQGISMSVYCTPDATRLSLETPVRHYDQVSLGLQGRHQAVNAVTTVRLLEGLAGQGIKVSTPAIISGLTNVTWHGRLEWIKVPSGRVLLDAAHNPAAARTLAEYLAEVRDAPLSFVLAVMRDKDIAGIIDMLAPLASHIVCTTMATERAISASTLADCVRERSPKTNVAVESDPQAAVALALSDAPDTCATGSIFLVGHLLSTIEANENIRCTLTDDYAG